jgi:hypothetical protein
MRHPITAFLKDWGIPAVSGIAFCVAAWVRFEITANEHAREIRQLGETLGRATRYGPAGLLDPEIHSGLDNQIRDETRECLRLSEWKRFHDALFQLNPNLVRPKGE